MEKLLKIAKEIYPYIIQNIRMNNFEIYNLWITECNQNLTDEEIKWVLDYIRNTKNVEDKKGELYYE